MQTNDDAIHTLQKAILYIMEYENALTVQRDATSGDITPVDVVRKLTEYNKVLMDTQGQGVQGTHQYAFTIKDENAEQEIAKIHNRIRKWKYKPHQKNSQIVQAYFECQKQHGKVLEKTLSAYCINTLDMKSFYINFNQMCTIAPKNHGKIFDVQENGEVVLWEPVAQYVTKVWQSDDSRISGQNNQH